MESAVRPLRRSSRLLALAGLAATAFGCGGRTETIASDDGGLDRVRQIKIAVTTIGAVTNETYPTKAWMDVKRSTERAYTTLTEGQVFGWARIDELAADQRKAEKRVAAAPGKRAQPAAKEREPKPAAKPAPKSEPKP
jgi:hypothetical protein